MATREPLGSTFRWVPIVVPSIPVNNRNPPISPKMMEIALPNNSKSRPIMFLTPRSTPRKSVASKRGFGCVHNDGEVEDIVPQYEVCLSSNPLQARFLVRSDLNRYDLASFEGQDTSSVESLPTEYPLVVDHGPMRTQDACWRFPIIQRHISLFCYKKKSWFLLEMR